jgi:trimethylamine:corrinoid methyltransferase-like protein
VQGISVIDETLALQELREVGTKGGDFLRLRHTLTWFRKEHYMPGALVDRIPYEAWQEQGSMNSLSRARADVTSILESHQAPPLNTEQQQGLDEVVRNFMKRHKSPSLPGSLN